MPTVVTIREAEEKLEQIREYIHLYKRVIDEHFSAREIVTETEEGEGVVIQPPLSIPKLDAMMERIEGLHKKESKIRTAMERFKATKTFEY